MEISPTLGHWEGVDRKLDDRQVARAEIAGYLCRDYTDQQTGASVQLLIVCGRPGPISLHTPDVCYQGIGFRMVAEPKRQHVHQEAGKDAQFWTGLFAKQKAAIQENRRIYWSWSVDGSWVAAGNPRFTFLLDSALYKIYVVRNVTDVNQPLEEDPALGFLKVLLPELDKKLFTPAAS